MPRLQVRDTCGWVTSRSRSVSIDEGALNRLSDRLFQEPSLLTVPPWDRSRHFWGDEKSTANFLLALDALNFCFWQTDPIRWRVQDQGQWFNGYWALAISLKRAIAGGYDLTDARTMARADAASLRRVFQGEGEIPLLESRVDNLNEAGSVLESSFGGQFAELVLAAGRSATRLVELVVSNFRSFEDFACYDSHRIHFFKRAQILAADLAAAFSGKGLGRLDNLAELTAFADYKVPQVLRELGVLHYRPDLATEVDRRQELGAGSTAEVEIRAATVVAVSQLRQRLQSRGSTVTESGLDGVLWHLGQTMSFQHPYHRTRTIYY